MSKSQEKKPGFEDSLSELEELVGKLESGDLSLDQSLECFKRGVELTRQCQSVLDQAQQTVEALTQQDSATEKSSVDEPD